MDGEQYRRGLNDALNRIKVIAQTDGPEAAVVVDRATGHELDFQVGDRDSVTPDWSKIPSGSTVTVLHTHPINIAFGPEDWDVLANHAEVIEIQAVCPIQVFVLTKPANWEFQRACKPGFSVLGSVFERTLAEVCSEQQFDEIEFRNTQETRAAQIFEANCRMPRSFVARGFQFSGSE